MRLISLLGFCAFGFSASASDWPRFQGTSGNGISEETGLIHQFPAEGLSAQWTVEVGRGYGGAAIRDGEVYILDRSAEEKDVLRAFDLETGTERWSFENEVPGRLMYAGSRNVPTVEEELIYAMGGFGQVYCINRQTGEAEWILDLVKEYDGEMPMFGYANSPLVVEDLVIVAPMGQEVGLLALDRFTGDEVWTTPGVGTSHSTPVLLELMGEPQILFLSAHIDMSVFENMPADATPPPPPEPGEEGSAVPEHMADFQVRGTGLLTSVSPEGEVLWQWDGYFCSTPIPPPMKIDDRRLFLTGGYSAGSVLIELVDGDEGVEVKELFRHERGTQIHLPVRSGDHLYLLANENNNDPRRRRKNGGLMCLDLEGNEKWRTGDDPYLGRGNVVLADGMLLVQDGYNGTLRLVEPTPEAYRPIAQSKIFDLSERRDHQVWAPMALSHGRLVMRSQEEMKCLDLRAAASSE